jgi:hypothetical protein
MFCKTNKEAYKIFFFILLFVSEIGFSQEVKRVHGIELPPNFNGKIVEMSGFRTENADRSYLNLIAIGAEFFIDSIQNEYDISIPINIYEKDFLPTYRKVKSNIKNVKPMGKKLILEAINDYVFEAVQSVYEVIKEYGYPGNRAMLKRLYDLDYPLYCYSIILDDTISDSEKNSAYENHENLYNTTKQNHVIGAEISIGVMKTLNEVKKKFK